MQKNQNCHKHSPGQGKWSAKCQLKRSNVKVKGRLKPLEIAAYLAQVVNGSGTNCKLGLTIVRPRFQMAPEPPAAGTGWTAACCVSTQS